MLILFLLILFTSYKRQMFSTYLQFIELFFCEVLGGWESNIEGVQFTRTYSKTNFAFNPLATPRTKQFHKHFSLKDPKTCINSFYCIKLPQKSNYVSFESYFGNLFWIIFPIQPGRNILELIFGSTFSLSCHLKLGYVSQFVREITH